MLSTLPRPLLSSTLVVDVLSVKQYAKETMLKGLPDDADILCLHPMFGPASGKNSWHGLPLVYEMTRITDYHRASRFLSLFEDEGCRMVRMSCEQHDALAAGSQVRSPIHVMCSCAICPCDARVIGSCAPARDIPTHPAISLMVVSVAATQFVTHLTGRLLGKLNIQPSPIATAGFKALLQLVENTCTPL